MSQMAPQSKWEKAWAKQQPVLPVLTCFTKWTAVCLYGCVRVCGCLCHRGKWWQTMANWSEGFPLLVHHANREQKQGGIWKKKGCQKHTDAQSGKHSGQVFTKASELQRVRWRITEEQFQRAAFCKKIHHSFSLFLNWLILCWIYQRLHGHLRPGKYRGDQNKYLLSSCAKQNHLSSWVQRKEIIWQTGFLSWLKSTPLLSERCKHQSWTYTTAWMCHSTMIWLLCSSFICRSLSNRIIPWWPPPPL